MNLLTVEEAARDLRMSKRVVREMCVRKRLRASKVGLRRWLIPRSEIERIVNEGFER